jgi:hypothetical protein
MNDWFLKLLSLEHKGKWTMMANYKCEIFSNVFLILEFVLYVVQ